MAVFDGQRLTVYETDGTKRELTAGDQGESGVLQLPKTDAYANEIAYFAGCVEKGKPADMVKPQELKTVLELLKAF